jgi:hypothetical protein
MAGLSYGLLGGFDSHSRHRSPVVYVGGMSEQQQSKELVDSLELVFNGQLGILREQKSGPVVERSFLWNQIWNLAGHLLQLEEFIVEAEWLDQKGAFNPADLESARDSYSRMRWAFDSRAEWVAIYEKEKMSRNESARASSGRVKAERLFSHGFIEMGPTNHGGSGMSHGR